MDAVMLAALLAVVAVGAGAALGSAAVWVVEVRPSRRREEALRASVDDLGWLMERQRDGARAQMEVLEERERAERERADELGLELYRERLVSAGFEAMFGADAAVGS